MEQETKPSQEKKLVEAPTSRRSLLKGLAVGAGAGTLGSGLLSAGLFTPTFVHAQRAGSGPTKGDVAILRFLAAAEILESDLWEQYNELGGIQDAEEPGGSAIPAYVTALQKLDMDMPQYIHDNTDDEFSHALFINEYLEAIGAEPVNLEAFRTLEGSKAKGASGKLRLTNLKELTVDTSFWTRYRSSTGNPVLSIP